MKREFVPSFDTQDVLQLVGSNIKAARLRRNESESMLADRLGVSRATVGRLEAGHVGVAVGVLVQALLIYGFGTQLYALGDPDSDGVGKRNDRLRRPAKGNGRAARLTGRAA